jgi:hypothetical protein
MGMNKLEVTDGVRKRRTNTLLDHFNNYTDGGVWTKGGTGTGVTNVDSLGGNLTFTTGAVLGQTAYVATTRKNWQFVTGQPLELVAIFNYTEGNVNNAGIFIGFTSAMSAMLSSAGVPLAAGASVCYCGIYKAPGDTVWSALTSCNSVQSITKSNRSCLLPGSNQELEIRVMMTPDGNLEATFSAGGLGPTTITGGGPQGETWMYPATPGPAFQPIKHRMAYANSVLMGFGAFLVAGSSTGEVMNLDFIAASMLQNP